jgi:rubrerythrin
MSIYTKPNWRAIYKKHHGFIPKEPDGRSYEIHHIDGDRTNNNITNLVALTAQEHYNIHFSQGDWAACARLGWRLSLPVETISELRRQAANEAVANGTHNFLGGDIQTRSNRKRVADGTHHLLNKQIHIDRNKKLVEEGRHYFQSVEYKEIAKQRQLNRLKEGTHPWQDTELQRKKQEKILAEGRHQSQIKWVCPHCQTNGNGKGNYIRWHGDKCKLAPTNLD